MENDININNPVPGGDPTNGAGGGQPANAQAPASDYAALFASLGIEASDEGSAREYIESLRSHKSSAETYQREAEEFKAKYNSIPQFLHSITDELGGEGDDMAIARTLAGKLNDYTTDWKAMADTNPAAVIAERYFRDGKGNVSRENALELANDEIEAIRQRAASDEIANRIASGKAQALVASLDAEKPKFERRAASGPTAEQLAAEEAALRKAYDAATSQPIKLNLGDEVAFEVGAEDRQRIHEIALNPAAYIQDKFIKDGIWDYSAFMGMVALLENSHKIVSKVQRDSAGAGAANVANQMFNVNNPQARSTEAPRIKTLDEVIEGMGKSGR